MAITLRDRHEELPEEADFRPLGRYVLFAALLLVAAGGGVRLLSSDPEKSTPPEAASVKQKPVGAPQRAAAAARVVGAQPTVRRVDIDPTPVGSINPPTVDIAPERPAGGFGPMQRAPDGAYQGFRVTAGR